MLAPLTALAGVAVVASEALAEARLAVAHALVGALGVIMRRVVQLNVARVAHVRERLGDSEGAALPVHIRDLHLDVGVAQGQVRGAIEVTLGAVDVRQAEGARACGLNHRGVRKRHHPEDRRMSAATHAQSSLLPASCGSKCTCRSSCSHRGHCMRSGTRH
jgi:hypothetical protein